MITLGEIQARMSKISGWGLEGNSITKEFNFNSFKDSIDFFNKLAEISLALEHIPSIHIESNQVRVILTTHTDKGEELSSKDFNLAEEIDKISI